MQKIQSADRLKLLGQEQEARLKLTIERQQEHETHQTSQLTELEPIKRAALARDQQEEFNKIGLQLAHVKEEELRKAAEKATAQEKKKLAVKWAQQANKDIIQHVIENLQQSKKQQDLEKFTIFVQQ